MFWLIGVSASFGQKVKVVDDRGEPLSGVFISCAPFKLEYQDDPDRIITNDEGRALLASFGFPFKRDGQQ